MLRERSGRVSNTRRSKVACDYCKSKKLKCDTDQPSCRNCHEHAETCVRQLPVSRPRPTNQRISLLEEENRRLKELARLSAHVPLREEELSDDNIISPDNRGAEDPPAYEGSTQSQQIHSSSQAHDLSPSGIRVELQAVDTEENVAEAPESHQSGFHGPPSALYDGYTPHQTPSQQVPLSGDSAVDESWKTYILVARSAKHRQQENINLAKGALDFDGVEPSLAMELLTIWFSRQFHLGLIVSRSQFMRDMACGGPYFSRLLLNAIYFSTSKHCMRAEIRHQSGEESSAGWAFRARFKKLLQESFDRSSVTSAQALLIMASSLFSRCDERSTSWLYSGMASSMIVDMGLHICSGSATSSATPESLEEEEIRRRVYWGAYIIDKMHCLYQGRPAQLRISDTNMEKNFLDDLEELEEFTPISYCNVWTYSAVPSHLISIMVKFRSLSVIIEHALAELYSTRGSFRSTQSLQEASDSIMLELKEWRRSLPSHIDVLSPQFSGPCPLPTNLTLLSIYNVLIILVRRQLLFDERIYTGAHAKSQEALVECFSAANEIIRLIGIYSRLFAMDKAPYILSHATYVAANIYVHILAKSGTNDAADSLQICCRALDEHQHLYAASRRARKIIDDLRARMGVPLHFDIRLESTASVATPAHGFQGRLEAHEAPGSAFLFSSDAQVIDDVMAWDSQFDSTGRFPDGFDLDAVLQSFIQVDVPQSMTLI